MARIASTIGHPCPHKVIDAVCWECSYQLAQKRYNDAAAERDRLKALLLALDRPSGHQDRPCTCGAPLREGGH